MASTVASCVQLAFSSLRAFRHRSRTVCLASHGVFVKTGCRSRLLAGQHAGALASAAGLTEKVNVALQYLRKKMIYEIADKAFLDEEYE